MNLTPEQIVASLSSLDLFDRLSNEALHRIVSLGQYRNIPEGVLLFQEGDQGDRLYVILTGELNVHPKGAPDKTQALRGKGEVFGEIALLDGMPRTASVTASSDCELFELSREGFESFLVEEPVMALNVVRLINRKVRSALERERTLNQELERLNASLEHLVELKTAQLLETNETLRELAERDALTGAFNRRMFHIKLRALLDKGEPVGLLLLDVDHFKSFNDTHGHQAGDRVLMQTVEVVAGCLREGQYLARYGGEEFAVILSRASPEVSQRVAENIRKAIAGHHFSIRNCKPGDVTASLGVAVFPDHANQENLLIEAADKALYQAKNQGRNRVVLTS